MPRSGPYPSQKYFLDACRINYLIKYKLDNSQTISHFIKKYNMSTNTANRFDTVYDSNNNNLLKGLDTSKIKHPQLGLIEIDKKVLDFIEQQLDQTINEHGQEFEFKDDILKSIKENIINFLKNEGEIKMSNKAINLGIDNGNAEIKVCYGENRTFKFDSKISTKWSEYEVFDNNSIKIDDSEYFIIANPYDNFIKSEKKAKASKKPIFAFAIAKALEELEVAEDVATVNICMLNPVGENDDFEAIKSQVMELNGALLRYKTMDKKQWKEVMVNINNVSILAEGIASYLALDDVSNNVCLIDCGSKTTNYIMGNNGNIMDAGTINLGTDNYFRTMAGINRKDEDTIKEMIATGVIEHNSEEFGKVLMNILNEVSKLATGFSKSNRIIMTGGGIALAE